MYRYIVKLILSMSNRHHLVCNRSLSDVIINCTDVVFHKLYYRSKVFKGKFF